MDLDNLIFSQPKGAEQALDATIALVRSKALAIVVLDSVASLVTRVEQTEAQSDNMSLAALLSEKLKLLSNEAKQADTAVVMINQLRVTKRAFGRTGEDSPGGKALKHFASIRAKISRGIEIKLDGL